MAHYDHADLILSFDGGCWPNPGGTPTYGWHLDTSAGLRVAEGNGSLPNLPPEARTNNTAELAAMLAGLRWLAAQPEARANVLTVRGDSRFALDVAAGRWRVKKPHLTELLAAIRAVMLLVTAFTGHVEFAWTPRAGNAKADALAGAARRAHLEHGRVK